MSNDIVIENQKTGNPPSEWGLSGPPSSAIEGFTTEFSTNSGEIAAFKIRTDATDYRIDIYRLGYYGGDGARLITTIQHQANPIAQPSPLVDSATGLVDAGNWQITDIWETPDDLVSGVYIAKLVRQDGTFGENQIPFIIKNENSSSDIVFQTDDTTWQAYNSWGGHSLYDGSVAVSYNRPFSQYAPETGAPATALGQLFHYNYPAIRWLEQNGYDVSYISGVDTARDGEALLGHNTFISAGHDEYWSGQQRANVEAARDAGVNLVFWGGNDVYWKTRWEPSIDDSSQDYRTLVSYKTSQSGRIDPSGEWTGLWRDTAATSKYGITPENALIGTFYMIYNSPSEGFDSFVVDSSSSANRFWRNTDVAALAPGESLSLGNYLGYEWNVDAYNGVRPSGLIHLSSTMAPVMPLPDPTNPYYAGYQYTLPDPPGYATHNLTLYRAESGALVFSAGTISWAWALDEVHNGDVMPASLAIQQAMVNLFADMGNQPLSLRTDLVPAFLSEDVLAPVTAIGSMDVQESGSTSLIMLTGTALDFGGGTVAGVQVSTNGGDTWSLAEGTTAWEYSWSTNDLNLDNIRVTAIDDSVNIGIASSISPTNLAWLGETNVGTTDLGWDNIKYTRIMADLNGDRGFDYVGFGEEAIYVNFGGTVDGLPTIDFSKGVILGEFSNAQGFTAASARGVDFVGGFGMANPAFQPSIIWGQTENGISYFYPTASSADTVEFESDPKNIDAFGLKDGWSPNHSFEFAFVSRGTDSSASIVGFGDDGIWMLAQPFDSTASSAAYLVDGSELFGNVAGWDSAIDLRAVSDFRGNALDLNSDGLIDVLGVGAAGIVYAFGQQEGQTESGSYSLGPAHAAYPGGVGFSRGEGWANSETMRILADVNGDEHVDVVGFGDAGVWLALGDAPLADGSQAFALPYLASPAFGNAQGWDLQHNQYGLSEVNGDGLLDIVGFGDALTAISVGEVADGRFSWSSLTTTPDYSSSTSWSNEFHLRTTADVNGDGSEEFVVSGDAMTYILRYQPNTLGA